MVLLFFRRSVCRVGSGGVVGYHDPRTLGVVVSDMDSRPEGTGFDSWFGEKIGERLEARNGTGDWRPVRGGDCDNAGMA